MGTQVLYRVKDQYETKSHIVITNKVGEADILLGL